MKFKSIAGAATALAVAGMMFASPAFATEEVTPEITEIVEATPEVIVEAPVEAVVEEAPVVEEAEVPVPVVETKTPAGPVGPITQPEPFKPYEVSVRWIIPATWDFKKTPTYQAAIFPQARGTVIPCNQWAQDDVYSIDDKGDEKLYLSLGDTLEMGEDSAIYKSHTFVKGEACGPVTITVPIFEPTPPTCDTAGSLPFLGNPAAQNPNGYEFPGQGFRVYVSPAFTGAGTYTLTIQKIGAGFDAAFPYGTKVTGETKQTLTVLPATGVTQSTDPEGACYVAPPVEPPVEEEPPATEEPPVVEEQPPVVTETETVALVTEQRAAPAQPVADELAYTGTDEAAATRSLALGLSGALALVLGVGLALLARSRRAQDA